MNVLHIIDSLGLGGAQTVVKGIFEKQKETENIFLFALRKREITTESSHKNIIIYNSKSRYSLLPIFNLQKIIKEKDIDILHCHLLRSQVFGLALKKIFFPKIRLLFHEHGEIFEKKPQFIIFLKLCKKDVDLFIAVSEATKQKLIGDAAIPEGKIKVLYNFVDSSEFNPGVLEKDSRDKQRAKLGIENNDFVVGFVGRLVRIKNVDKIIESLPLIIPEIPKVKLIVVGDGPEKKELQKLVHNFKLKEYVKFLGFRTDLPEIISTFDVGILVSDYENLSIYILELIAMDKYVIATNVGGNPEIINNKIGRLIDKPTPHLILEAIKELQKTKKNITDFHETKKKFALPLFIQDLENLYCSLDQR